MCMFVGNIHILVNEHTIQGSPQVDIKAKPVDVVWAEFVTTASDFLPTPKLKT